MFCHITTRIEGEKYGDLLSEKGGNGFPYLVFMDAKGDVLAVHEGHRKIDAFDETAKKAQEYFDLKKKADAGDKGAIVQVVFKELDAGRMKMADADKKLSGVELTDEKKKELEKIRPNAEVREIVEEIKAESDAAAAGKKFAERDKAGKPEPSDEQLVQKYWIIMMKYAETEKDAALYEKGLKALEAKFGSNPQAKGFFDKAHATLDKLKAESKKKD